jgi:hypothetical protein
VTSTSPCSPFASPRIRLAAPAVAAPAGASVVGEGFFDAEIPPSFRLGALVTAVCADIPHKRVHNSGMPNMIEVLAVQARPDG